MEGRGMAWERFPTGFSSVMLLALALTHTRTHADGHTTGRHPLSTDRIERTREEGINCHE